MEIRAPGADELTRVIEIMRSAFSSTGTGEGWQRFRELVGRESFRVAMRGGEVAGGLALHDMGQFFGGRSVPMTGIGAVAVAPEHRGSGVATRLMCAVVRDLHERGTALSALYPATEALYRRAGYEQGGSHCLMRLPHSSILVRDRELPIKRVEEADMETVRAIYRRRAAGSPGNLDRSGLSWHEITRDTRGYLFGDEGYLFYKEFRPPQERRDVLYVRDHAATSPKAVRRLLTFLADHSSIRFESWLFVGPSDPLLALVEEQRYKARYLEHWMLRVTHLPNALQARGYARGVQVELDLAVADDVIADNAGRWRVRVEDGVGSVEPGGRGEIEIDVRALASLYSGQLSVATLRAAGWIDGPEAALEAAQTAFSGPAPWMSDEF